MSNLRAIAKKEIAKEKGTLSGKRRKKRTTLDQAAEKWTTEQQIKTKKANDKEKTSQAFGEFKSLTQADLNERARQQYPESGLSWHQYKPGAEEGVPEQKPMSINSATIRGIAKKLIAREWRKARGIPRRDVRVDQLELAATSYYKQKELERKLEEEKQRKLMRYADHLNNLLNEYALGLSQGAVWGDAVDTAEDFEELLEELGDIYKLQWEADQCQVWLEPWAEIRDRRANDLADPVIYMATIDANMNIASVEQNEDEGFLMELREEELASAFEALMMEGVVEEDELDELLEEAISDLGRIVSFNQTFMGWIASVEPWEEMRLRKINKMEEASATLKQIIIDQSNGEIKVNIYNV